MRGAVLDAYAGVSSGHARAAQRARQRRLAPLAALEEPHGAGAEGDEGDTREDDAREQRGRKAVAGARVWGGGGGGGRLRGGERDVLVWRGGERDVSDG